MKKQLLGLIQQHENIKLYFHAGGRTKVNTVYDTAEFAAWKKEIQFELQEIHDRTRDSFIWDTLTILRQGFNGWKDEVSFNELKGSLIAISNNIDKYYPKVIVQNIGGDGVNDMQHKSSKIFISHATIDKGYVSILVDLLEDIGLNENQIFCSSVSGYDIPLGEDIYEYLFQQFKDYELHVIFVLSDNYYNSVACMNEMGAAWVLQSKYNTILLPGFEFKEIKGAINPRKIALKLDNEMIDIKEKLGQLKNRLIAEFGLHTITDVRWEQKREKFINAISELSIYL